MADTFYKNNAQLRYQLSKELEIYYQNKMDIEKRKINPFILPLFSSIIAISTAFSGYLAKDCNYGTSAYWFPVIMLGLLIITYAICRLIIMPIFQKSCNIINGLRSVNRKAFNTISYKEERRLSAKFDFDVTGLVYLSYIIATDKNIHDHNLYEYNISEALFYLDRTLKKLNNIFVLHVNHKPNIYEYRIQNTMKLLGASIISISKDCRSEDNLEACIENIKHRFNIIAKTINKKYEKELVSLL